MNHPPKYRQPFKQMEIAKIISAITGVDVDQIYTNSFHNNGDMTLDIRGNADIQPDGNGAFIISTVCSIVSIRFRFYYF